MLGIDGERLVVVLQRAVGVARLAGRIAHQIVGVGVLRVLGDGLLQIGHRLLVTLGLDQRLALREVGIDRIRREAVTAAAARAPGDAAACAASATRGQNRVCETEPKGGYGDDEGGDAHGTLLFRGILTAASIPATKLT